MTRINQNRSHKSPNFRINFLSFLIFSFSIFLVYRLFDLQVLSNTELQAQASKQHSTVRELPSERGEIFYRETESKELYPIATNREFNHVYIVPRDVEDINTAFEKLWPLLEPYGLTKDQLEYRLSKKNDIYEPLAHKITEIDLAPFIDLNLAGLGWEKETWRYYPEQETLSQVIGFVGLQGEHRVGQYGLEGYFEESLAGTAGILEGKVDVSGRLIQTGLSTRVEPEEGIDLVLTIDRALQSFACQKLSEQIENVGASKGSIIIVDPKTGAILTMCSSPGFNPNTYNEVEDINIYLNPTIAATYEPGSIFKPITMAAAIDKGSVTSETMYVDEGFEKIGKYTIKNSDGKAHGEVDMVTVLDESLNTGAIFVQRQLGHDSFREYVEKFGFGRTTDVELGNELSGDISSLYKHGDIYAATASFGQGITTTPLQMVMSYAAIANSGTLMRPYIIAERRRGDDIIKTTKPSEVDEVISLRASTIVSGMLVSVISSGHAKSAGVEGYYIAGKTGTAQVAEAGEYGEQTIHSFVGFGPVDNPVFAMLVKLDHPQYGIFAASTAAPLFGDIAEFILQYYKVPPDE